MSECLFCGIIEGKIKGDIVYQDESVVAFNDIGPKAPVHILIVPRKHIATVMDIAQTDGQLIGESFASRPNWRRSAELPKAGFASW